MSGPRPFVDYEQAADRYDAGRSLEDDTLESWRRAIAARVTPAGRTVLDLGAGTGIFARAWIAWGAREVIAVEPSAAMREQAAARPGRGIRVMDGSAHELPAEASAIDVVWMSAVLHHVQDLDRCALEIRRVLRAGGHLLIRGYLPDRSRVPWLVRQVDAVEVPEPRRHSRGEAAAWIDRMRGADSLLTVLTPTEIDEGIAALREEPAELLPPLELTLLTFSAPA